MWCQHWKQQCLSVSEVLCARGVKHYKEWSGAGLSLVIIYVLKVIILSSLYLLRKGNGLFYPQHLTLGNSSVQHLLPQGVGITLYPYVVIDSRRSIIPSLSIIGNR